MTNRYLMESAEEALRLEAKTDRAGTLERLQRVGLGPGMRALDAGAGTGAVARVMAELVGSQGRVLSLDFSRERADYGAHLAQEQGLDNLGFVVSNVYSPALRPGTFDFVWSQFLFQYLSDPDAVLRQLLAVLRSGGKLVVADIDGYGFFHYPIPTELVSVLRKLEKALEGTFDPYAGRKLFHRFRRAGLEKIAVHLFPYHLYAGTAPAEAVSNWETKLRTIRPKAAHALGGPAEYDRLSRAFLDLLRDPDAMTYSVLFVAEGIKR